jgi:2-hydroxymuconate-semialdehyde hydrolase
VRPESARFRCSGGDLAFVDVGDGPAALLIHGFPTWSYLWRRLMPPLSARMRVIAPDLLGYGRSDKPEDGDLSIRAQAGYLEELLDHLGIERPAVVGHDIGGGVAQLLALKGRAGALVAIDAICFDVWPIEGVKMIQSAEPGQESAEFVDQLVRLTFDLGLAKGALAEEDLHAYADPWRGDPSAFFRAARGIDGIGLAGREDELSNLDIPALIVWGEEDPFLPPALGERLGEAIPMSMTALLPGCSHFVTEDAGPTVEQLVHEFLRLRYLGESHGHAPEGPVPIYLRRPTSEEVAAAGEDD